MRASLGLRTPTDHPKQVFTLPYRMPSDGSLDSLILVRPAAEHSDDSLSQRGWTLQEFAFRRGSSIFHQQTRWICQKYYVDGWQMHGGLRKAYNLRLRVMDMLLAGDISTARQSLFTFDEACGF